MFTEDRFMKVQSIEASTIKTENHPAMAEKNVSLIIDIRDQLPWQKRYFSNSTTLLLLMEFDLKNKTYC